MSARAGSSSEPRTEVIKTWKLFISGAYPRGESGKTMPLCNAKGELVAHLCAASRKDLREAVEAARGAQGAWARATPYMRGQVVYRLAEMLESRREELVEACRVAGGVGRREASRSVADALDSLVSMAGWSDKASMILGSQNPVAGPFYNFTSVEPAGVVAIVGSGSMECVCAAIGAAMAMGNAVVVVATPEIALPCLILAEACACSDVPGGVVNVLTAEPAELASSLAGVIASHRDIRVVHAWLPCDGAAAAGEASAPSGAPAASAAPIATTLQAGTAENLKRVHIHQSGADADSLRTPAFLSQMIELKTVWMPRAV
ncbi:MAG: aldehyde dehydrogenase family protein [Planctomycetota bacterium]|nr:aldehyde dehydrogenase family protein [Planctomycetota bacterium]MDA1105384.1 aldehyde dehydrogenase family protein [Planctomycetota bacterium]